MSKVKLNPSEEKLHEVSSNPKLKTKVKNRYAIVIGVFLVIIGALFLIPAKTDDIMKFPAYLSMAIGVIFIAFYFVKVNEKKDLELATYIITNTRVLKVVNDEIVDSIIIAKIKSLEVDKISGKSGDVVINKKLLDPAKSQSLERKGEVGPFYTKDTFVLDSISNAQDVADKIK